MTVETGAASARARTSLNVIANYAAKLWSITSVYLFVPMYIHLLGVEAYGLIAFYAMALAILFVADAGISSTFAREAAHESDKAKLLDLLSSFERVLFCVLGAVAVAILLGADFIAADWLNTSGKLQPGTEVTSIRLMALAIVPQIAMALYLGGLMGLQKQVAANAVTVLFSIVRAAVVLLPLLMFKDVRVYFVWQVAASWFFLLLARHFLRKQLNAASWRSGRFSLPLLKPLLGYAAGMFAMALIAGINTQIDRLVVSKLLPIQAFTFYSLAAMMAQAPSIIVTPIASAISPQLVALTNQANRKALQSLYEKFSFAVAALGSSAAFGLYFFGDALIQLWLNGQHFPAETSVTIKLLAVGSLFLALQLGPYYLSLAHGYTKTNVRLGLTMLFLVVPAQIYFTGHFGMIGAAVPWLVVNLIAFLYLGFDLNGRFNRGFTGRWFALCAAIPVAISGMSFFLASVAVKTIGVSAIAEVLVAAVCGVASLVASAGVWKAGNSKAYLSV